jgi:hypothetical protein
MCSLVLYLFTADKTCLAFTVIRCDNEVYSSVNANYITNVRETVFFNIVSHRDMKKVLLLLSIYILSTTVSEAQSLSNKYNAQRPVIIVCDWDKPPYEYLDDKGFVEIK